MFGFPAHTGRPAVATAADCCYACTDTPGCNVSAAAAGIWTALLPAESRLMWQDVFLRHVKLGACMLSQKEVCPAASYSWIWRVCMPEAATVWRRFGTFATCLEAAALDAPVTNLGHQISPRNRRSLPMCAPFLAACSWCSWCMSPCHKGGTSLETILSFYFGVPLLTRYSGSCAMCRCLYLVTSMVQYFALG